MENNNRLETDKTWVQEVIISTTKRRGKGIEGDPIRIVTQIFLKDGTLIAENDPYQQAEQVKKYDPFKFATY